MYIKPIFAVLLILNVIFTNHSTYAQKHKAPGAADSIEIFNYNLSINLVYLSKKTISGVAEIKLTPKMQGVETIALDLLKLNVDSVQINNITTIFTYNDTVIRIPFQDKGIPGDTAIITVFYNGQPVIDATGWGGFYFSNDSSYAYNLGVGFGADPHSYGRVWFPCIDDFRSRATYDFKVRVKNTNKAVCSGVLIDTYCAGNNTAIYHWKIKTPIPSYLVGIAVGKYTVVPSVYNGLNGAVPVELYVRPSDSMKAVNSFTNLHSIITVFENRFGPFQWERVGYVGVPFNNGAMEHATNIAYPNACIDGTLSYESLLAHELAHNWFGNLITCSTEADMWINEGWASYCESIYKEGLYGTNSYKSDVRTRHREVLQKAHITDGSYLALYGIPHQYTYGTTVYDKGAGVVHTLRAYMGDSIFFNSVTQLLTDNAYTDIDSYELRDKLAAYSGINLDEFFDTWVFKPGFPHFSIDSLDVLPDGNGSICTVYLRQKLKGTSTFYNNNKIDITFFDNAWNKFTVTANFSGQYGNATFNVPFVPSFAIADIEERLADASVDSYKTIKSNGTYNFNETYFILETTQISDSAFVRAENNWVAPDPFKTPVPGTVISNHRYWKIDGIFPAGFISKGKFFYSKLNNLDNQLITNHIDSLLILYRANTADDWQPIPFVRSGSSSAGYLIVDTLKPGEYVLGISAYSHPFSTGELNKQDKNNLKVFPNPSEGLFNFSFTNTGPAILKIFRGDGSLVNSIAVPSQQGSAVWHSGNNPPGTYLVVLSEQISNKNIGSNKIVLVK